MTQKKLINKLVKQGCLCKPLIIEAFASVNRRDFVLDDYKEASYEDTSLPIGMNQTISQPLTIAVMLELLQPQPGDKILEIGFGSGYQTALLAYLVSQNNKSGRVYAIERIKSLYEFGRHNLEKYDYIKEGTVKLFCQDGSQGLPEQAPFDCIIAAAAGHNVPVNFKEQVKLGGRIVMPIDSGIDQDIIRLEKKDENNFKETRKPGFAFVPLITGKN